jgi:uncharacterized membrane protein
METPNPTPNTVVPRFDPKDVAENNIYAALSYVSVLGVVMYLVKKDSKFVQEHAKQGVILFVAEIVIYIVGLVPVIGWFIVAPIGNILTLIAAIVAFIKAIQGEFWEIPGIGQYRNRVNF